MKYTRIILGLVMLALSACGSGKSPPPPYPGIKIGKPYEVFGRWYEPKYSAHYDEIGVASWYGPGFHGGHTANGESYDQNAMTAAHRTLPMPSIVRVTNLDNGVSALIKINDRGPFAHDRIIDLSHAAAAKLGVIRTGTAKVRVQFLEKETKEYVQNLTGGTYYAMDELKTVDPDEAGEREEEGTKPTLKIENKMFDNEAPTPGGDTVAPQVASSVLPPPADVPTPTPGGDEFAVVENASAAPALAPSHGLLIAPTGFMLQVGTFGQHANAMALSNRLEGESYPVQVMEVMIGSKKMFRVMVGPYPERENAKNMLSKLASAGISDAKIVHN